MVSSDEYLEFLENNMSLIQKMDGKILIEFLDSRYDLRTIICGSLKEGIGHSLDVLKQVEMDDKGYL